MEALQRFVRMFMGLSVGMTAVAIVTGGGSARFLLTLIALILVAAAAPYLLALAAMRRLPPRWGLAVAIATCLFGIADAAYRMQAFYFPNSPADGAMAIYMPLYSLAVIPVLALVSYPLIKLTNPSL